jgi:quinoprotein glucose dehydrogenase
MRELAKKGIKDTGGRAQRNGPVVTAGGLLFVGTASDNTVRAFDSAAGAVLWERELPSAPSGIPAVYEAGGRQFVVFYTTAAPTRRGEKPPADDPQGYHAFALPR